MTMIGPSLQWLHRTPAWWSLRSCQWITRVVFCVVVQLANSKKCSPNSSGSCGRGHAKAPCSSHTITLALVLTLTLTVLPAFAAHSPLPPPTPGSPNPHPPSPGPSTELSAALADTHGHTPPQIAWPHPPRRRTHHDLPQARREPHSFGRTHATHHGGCRAACSRRGLARSGPAATASRR